MEELELLQDQLDLHMKTLKKVDESIKHLNVTDKDLKRDNDDSIRSMKRVVSLGSNDRFKTKREHSPDRNDDSKNFKRKLSEEVPRKMRRSDLIDNHSGSDDEHHSRIQIKSSVVSSNMPIKSKEDLIKIQNKFTGSEQRNKRIIGVILGTLRQFKNDDKERSNTTQAINRKELEKKIEIKKIEEKKKIVEEKKKLEEEKSIAMNRVKILEEKILLTKEFKTWKENQLQYRKFIRTKTKPFIFFLPKELDTKSTSLLEETAILIDEQIAKKLKITEDEIKRLQLEESRLNTNNEKDLENKENNKNQNKDQQANGDSSESEMDEDKNINVRIGDDDEEDETNITKNAKETSKTDVIEPNGEIKTESIMESNTELQTNENQQNIEMA